MLVDASKIGAHGDCDDIVDIMLRASFSLKCSDVERLHYNNKTEFFSTEFVFLLLTFMFYFNIN